MALIGYYIPGLSVAGFGIGGITAINSILGDAWTFSIDRFVKSVRYPRWKSYLFVSTMKNDISDKLLISFHR